MHNTQAIPGYDRFSIHIIYKSPLRCLEYLHLICRLLWPVTDQVRVVSMIEFLNLLGDCVYR